MKNEFEPLIDSSKAYLDNRIEQLKVTTLIGLVNFGTSFTYTILLIGLLHLLFLLLELAFVFGIYALTADFLTTTLIAVGLHVLLTIFILTWLRKSFMNKLRNFYTRHLSEQLFHETTEDIPSTH
ncbi:MAG: hypothetical protein RLZZ301_1779 [Bacteroidota bacterium]|jgi:uncharacterized membrane protein YbhN (UPF0104 family)